MKTTKPWAIEEVLAIGISAIVLAASNFIWLNVDKLATPAGGIYNWVRIGWVVLLTAAGFIGHALGTGGIPFRERFALQTICSPMFVVTGVVLNSNDASPAFWEPFKLMPVLSAAFISIFVTFAYGTYTFDPTKPPAM